MGDPPPEIHSRRTHAGGRIYLLPLLAALGDAPGPDAPQPPSESAPEPEASPPPSGGDPEPDTPPPPGEGAPEPDAPPPVSEGDPGPDAPPAPSDAPPAESPPGPTPEDPSAPAAPVATRRSAPRRPTRRHSLPVRIWKRYFPPVRLVWIFLFVILWNGGGFANRTVLLPLLVLPAVAVVADLYLQYTRFPKVRFPDAAIATGLFLSLILWPTTVSIELAAVAAATIGIRHLVRFRGHPVLNPAALGVTLAAVLFALPQPWHVGATVTDTALVALLGLVLWSRAWHSWRLWAVFFAVNIAATLTIAEYLGGGSALPLVIKNSVLGAQTIFFGFFMVTEPRTAPSARWAKIPYAALIGLSSALLPLLFVQSPALAALGVLTPYLSLFAGNLFAAALPRARRRAAAASSAGGRVARPSLER
jgi:hypothetical protein